MSQSNLTVESPFSTLEYRTPGTYSSTLSTPRPVQTIDRFTICSPESITPTQREAIYQDFQPLVRRLIRQYGDSHELHQDLEGEIYCRFCDLLEAYDPGRGIALYAYLIRKLSTTTYAFARTQWRQRQWREKCEVSWEDQEEAGVQPSVPWDDPVEKWIVEDKKTDTLHALRENIQKLTERQRQVVIWRYYEAQSFEDIAEKLNVKPATVRSLLRHALNSLRGQLVETEKGTQPAKKTRRTRKKAE